MRVGGADRGDGGIMMWSELKRQPHIVHGG